MSPRLGGPTEPNNTEVAIVSQISNMESNSDRAESYYTALTHLSSRLGGPSDPNKTDILLKIKDLLREFSSIKQQIFELKAHVGKQDGTHPLMRNKVVPRTPNIQRVEPASTSSRKMNFIVLGDICEKIIQNGSLDGLTMAELQFIQESAYVAAIKKTMIEVELIEPSSDLDVCINRIQYLHTVLDSAKDNIRSLRKELKVR